MFDGSNMDKERYVNEMRAGYLSDENGKVIRMCIDFKTTAWNSKERGVEKRLIVHPIMAIKLAKDILRQAKIAGFNIE